MRSSLADTPAKGRIRHIKEDGDLQKALNDAACGETVELQAGGTYRGLFKVPAKKCDDSHWIIIRSSDSDHDLPPEGTRLKPCYAGVGELQGRPPFHCSQVKNVIARLQFEGNTGSGPIMLETGANHIRFMGLEITRKSSNATVSNLISLESRGTADHIVFDRMWIHGTTHDETTRGILLGGSTNVAIVDSFFSDFHCTARTGACVDSQAIAGGIGDNPMGPYKIANNYLEGAAEGILFGGGPATATPSDIEIRINHIFKPLAWRPGNADFVGANDGQPFIVKNLFELKNARRVLFENNILENVWGGFSQAGFAVLLTPKNQGQNSCPECQVTDITIRYCRIKHMASGLQIANGLSDNGSQALAGYGYSVHDVLFEDIGGPNYKGMGILAQISMALPLLHDVKLDHITAFPPKALFMIGGPVSGEKMHGFSFTNSIVAAGQNQIMSTGGGPLKNCAAQPDRKGIKGVLDDCFSAYEFHHNAILGGDRGYPRNNTEVKQIEDLGFSSYGTGNPGDYHLLPASRLKRHASDDKDVGADIEAIDSRTADAQ